MAINTSINTGISFSIPSSNVAQSLAKSTITTSTPSFLEFGAVAKTNTVSNAAEPINLDSPGDNITNDTRNDIPSDIRIVSSTSSLNVPCRGDGFSDDVSTLQCSQDTGITVTSLAVAQSNKTQTTNTNTPGNFQL